MPARQALTRRAAMAGVAGAWAAAAAAVSAQTAPTAPPAPARVMLLGLFHFDNPGGDAVKYTPIDVMQPAPQRDLEELVERLARYAPTKVLLEYPASRDDVMLQRYADHLAGRYVLPATEIYQIGFRLAKRLGHTRVHGFDTEAPPPAPRLWSQLGQMPAVERELMALIEAESRRQNERHARSTLRELLVLHNDEAEDRRNKGFYLMLNPAGTASETFLGADGAAHWWHRNLRMYALIQRHATPGERVLVIAGQGHTAVLRDLLRADDRRVEEPVQPFL
jgi:hypothetical protein